MSCSDENRPAVANVSQSNGKGDEGKGGCQELTGRKDGDR